MLSVSICLYSFVIQIVPSPFLRSFLLGLKPQFLIPIHIFFSETISLASVWLFGPAITLFPWIREEFLSSNKSDFIWSGENSSLALSDWIFSGRGFIVFSHERHWPSHVLFLDQTCTEELFEFSLIQMLPFGRESI